jgi:Tol biopolymer transport system component
VPSGWALSGNYNKATLSPDTRQLALQIDGANNDIWVLDLERDSLTRVTTRGENFAPAWTFDGRRLVFRSNRSGTLNLFATEPNGDGAVQQLTEFTTTPVGPAQPSVSPDGRVVAFVRVDPQTTSDLWLATLGEEHTAQPLIRTPFQESNPRISPNGQVLAYQSNESQRFEVYVQSLAGRGGRRQISANGGSSPMWSRDGKELFFLSGTSMMVARVSVTPTLTSSRPDVLFTGVDRCRNSTSRRPET